MPSGAVSAKRLCPRGLFRLLYMWRGGDRLSIFMVSLVTPLIYEPTMHVDMHGGWGERRGFSEMDVQGARMVMMAAGRGTKLHSHHVDKKDSCSRPCVDELYDQDLYQLINLVLGWISIPV